MESSKPVSCPLDAHFKLSSKLSTEKKDDVEHMKNVPYASVVGSLMYAMLCTRPDLAYSVGMFSRFLSRPGKKYWEAVKWVFRYLMGTSDLSICFGGGEAAHADIVGDLDMKRSTSEVEYIAVNECCKELLWLKKLFRELGIRQTVMYHWVREVLEKKLALIEKVHTNDNGADMFIKVLPEGKFDKCCSIAGLAVVPAATFH
ncbi:hypothetical protein LIER_10750 [Lithospermum erythrorhizon]|uniref:Retrovirus-related Pol polyprotein from transposon TNT 1-94 n=1 Tax=Lithospermum erythrorhizon TaxID=34254 RepID=A0AAV3PKQ6_LITER